ncbi:MAG TPA: DUF6293 family protein [Thermoplasmata archaeon]|nr:DUF6293 family protein [Thermoplasmata archaeon]
MAPTRRADRAGAASSGDPRARIHIAPVGYEVERVTEPILEDGADRAYLLTRSGDDSARPFVDEVARRLRSAPRPVEVRIRRAEIWDVFASLSEIRAIFEAERRADRRASGVVPIRVNVSTGTKITAIAGTLACMLWKGEPYYVQVSQSWYSHLTPKLHRVNDVVRSVDPVSVYELRTPAPELVELLAALDRRGGSLRKRELIGELGLDRARPGEGTGRPPTAQAQHSRLRHRLDPLEHRWGFVATDRAGPRGRVRLTDQGRLALALFGPPPKAPSAIG